ncbi:MAG: hypothetical protein GY822_30000 [Deltaproteobacteria bacterium]|nr:hypothetical protein [Deltaproteobacteria bacterium]
MMSRSLHEIQCLLLALEHYPLEMLQANPSNTSWSWGPLILARWYGKPKVQDIHDAGKAHYKHMEKWSEGGVVNLTILHQVRGLSLTDDCKEIAQEYRDQAASSILAGAIVIDGTGFFPALAQAILTGIVMIQKKPFDETFCRSDETAADFLASCVEEKYSKIDEESILMILRHIRSLEIPVSD